MWVAYIGYLPHVAATSFMLNVDDVLLQRHQCMRFKYY